MNAAQEIRALVSNCDGYALESHASHSGPWPHVARGHSFRCHGIDWACLGGLGCPTSREPMVKDHRHPLPGFCAELLGARGEVPVQWSTSLTF